MKTARRFVLFLACLIGLSSVAQAATPTIWEFLGLSGPKLKATFDATVNKHGYLPGLERKPPLKAIADPANLESDVSAIKVAAEMKQEEDKAPQKIKAIKYLAKAGCSGYGTCNQAVNGALVEALGDCSEDVRLEAAKALTKTAGNPCTRCSGPGCCTANGLEALQTHACGRDESGCYIEPSAKVRAAATEALKACRHVEHRFPHTGNGTIIETFDNEPEPILETFESTPAYEDEDEKTRKNSSGTPPLPPSTGTSRINGSTRSFGVSQAQDTQRRITSRALSQMRGPAAPGHAR